MPSQQGGATMTTEIAVLNRLGVALAADSAVTISGVDGTKIFNSAVKLFELSGVFPVAIMINGNMDLFGVPWEIIIKDFRAQNKGSGNCSMRDWATRFLKFIETRSDIDKQSEMSYVTYVIQTEIDLLKNAALEKFSENFMSNIKANLFLNILMDIISDRGRYLKEVYNAEGLFGIGSEDINNSYLSTMRELIESEFKPYVLSSEILDQICGNISTLPAAI